MKHWNDGRKILQFCKGPLRQSFILHKSLALQASSRCFYPRNSQTEVKNTAIHRYNRPICTEEGNKTCKGTRGQEVRAGVTITAAAHWLYFSSVLSSCFHLILTYAKPAGAKRNYTFLTISLSFFFSKQQCFFSCITTLFSSTKLQWIRVTSVTIRWQSRGRCIGHHKVEHCRPCSFWISPWKVLRIKHISSLTLTCCWALTHKTVFSLVVNIC